jgi:hypothetical protein
MKQVVVPKFSSEAEEAARWDTHRSEIEAEIRRRMKQRKPRWRKMPAGSSAEGA